MHYMKTIKSDRLAFFDCDDTLVLWPKLAKKVATYSNRHKLPWVTINGKQFRVHKAHIQKMKDYHTLGFVIVVWSNSGHKWAETVVKKLKLGKYVSIVMSKPHRIFDDKLSIKTVYLDPIKGEYEDR